MFVGGGRLCLQLRHVAEMLPSLNPAWESLASRATDLATEVRDSIPRPPQAPLAWFRIGYSYSWPMMMTMVMTMLMTMMMMMVVVMMMTTMCLRQIDGAIKAEAMTAEPTTGEGTVSEYCIRVGKGDGTSGRRRLPVS
jgi:hypothetical protein